MTATTQSAPAPASSLFSFDSHPVRITRDGDELWFVAQDVMSSLEYAEKYKPAKATEHVPPEWKGVYPIHTPGGTQKMLCISEPGLYFFLGRSDKPKALPFQKWLAGEVLPAIRKTGGYSAAPQFDPSAPHGEAIQFAMDYVTALHRHMEDPAGQPRPTWNEAESMRIADGIVSAWMLRNNRWLLSFDHNGKPSLSMVPQDACVMSVDRLLDAINEPNGLHVAPEKLFRFAQATLARLESAYAYQRATTGNR